MKLFGIAAGVVLLTLLNIIPVISANISLNYHPIERDGFGITSPPPVPNGWYIYKSSDGHWYHVHFSNGILDAKIIASPPGGC